MAGRRKRRTLAQVDAEGDVLAKLRRLAASLAEKIDGCEEPRELPSLARQYRETIMAIDDLDGGSGDDEVSIIVARAKNRKPGA